MRDILEWIVWIWIISLILDIEWSCEDSIEEEDVIETVEEAVKTSKKIYEAAKTAVEEPTETTDSLMHSEEFLKEQAEFDRMYNGN